MLDQVFLDDESFNEDVYSNQTLLLTLVTGHDSQYTKNYSFIKFGKKSTLTNFQHLMDDVCVS